ncbi:chalcone isomerase family protein [Massilia frigida]|uniref:chalcone isomerase family protein n=1 Tax=Massilia frigida TaxID=2609281 RepID=UPI00351D7914
MPGGGARFYLDGKALAALPDQEFARAFFGIWLDPATSARALRSALLKAAAAR